MPSLSSTSNSFVYEISNKLIFVNEQFVYVKLNKIKLIIVDILLNSVLEIETLLF